MRWIVYLLLFANLGYFIVKIREHQRAPVAMMPAVSQGNQVNRLPLLSEMSAGALHAREPESPPLAAGTADATPAIADADRAARRANCYSVGPLQDQLATDKVRGWLTEHQAQIVVREDERRETARYWVYFPPLKSRAAAVKRVKAMRAVGISDVIIIPRGDMSNAISLGVYTRKSSVDRRLAQLQAKGYQPSVVPRYRTVKATWVDVLLTGQQAQIDMDAFIAAFPNLGVSRRHCNAAQIAKAPKSPYNPRRPKRQYYFSGPETSPGSDAQDIQ